MKKRKQKSKLSCFVLKMKEKLKTLPMGRKCVSTPVEVNLKRSKTNKTSFHNGIEMHHLPVGCIYISEE
jgi:hypothetical protein